MTTPSPRHLGALVALLCAHMLWSAPAHAKYAPIPLHHMIGASDLVVIATIDALPSDTVMTLAIDEVIHGTIATKTLDVRRFQDWPCAVRWTPYKTGQKAVFFLWENAKTGEWRVRSAGNEGEVPIEGSNVVVRGSLVDGVPSGDHALSGATIYGQKFDLDTFVDAVRDYRTHFALKTKRDPWLQVVKTQRLTDAKARKSYADRSALHGALVKRTLASR